MKWIFEALRQFGRMQVIEYPDWPLPNRALCLYLYVLRDNWVIACSECLNLTQRGTIYSRKRCAGALVICPSWLIRRNAKPLHHHNQKTFFGSWVNRLTSFRTCQMIVSSNWLCHTWKAMSYLRTLFACAVSDCQKRKIEDFKKTKTGCRDTLNGCFSSETARIRHANQWEMLFCGSIFQNFWLQNN